MTKDVIDKFDIKGGFTYSELEDMAKKLKIKKRFLTYSAEDGLRFSLVDKCKDYLDIKEQLDIEIKKEIGDKLDYGLGYCHLYWETKKRILKEKYNIEWLSPAELNPMVCFD